MRRMNEQYPLNRNHPAYYAPRRLRERVRPEPFRSPTSHSPSLDPDVVDERVGRAGEPPSSTPQAASLQSLAS